MTYVYNMFTFVLLFLGSTALFAQSGSVQLEMMQQKYRTFDYDAVIELAENALQDTSELNKDELFQIYEMKAAAHYSKMQMQQALTSFMHILRLDPNHELDPVKTSPKIVNFYNEIKANFQSEQSKPDTLPKPQIQVVDTVRIVENSSGFYRKTLPASLLLPGTGHLLAGNGRKGTWLTTLSVISLSAAAYYTYSTHQKQEQYLNATDAQDIQRRYSAFNSAYKKRNVLWGAYAVLWAFAQTDLLFIQTPQYSVNFSYLPRNNFNPARILCSVHF